MGRTVDVPESVGRSDYSKLFYWNELPKGGHFAALEQPELFVAELRKSFAQLG
jgi:pimeloyl-ACP methyl ester carboxylesterase